MRLMRKLTVGRSLLVVLGCWPSCCCRPPSTRTRPDGETLIAELRSSRPGDREYLAHLRTGDRCDERACCGSLGDQWRIDAEFLKWKYWATLLGIDSQYRLDRLEGRYRTAAAQNTQPNLAHDSGRRQRSTVVSLAECARPVEFPDRRDLRQLDLYRHRSAERLLRVPHDHRDHHAFDAATAGCPRGGRSDRDRPRMRRAGAGLGSAWRAGPTPPRPCAAAALLRCVTRPSSTSQSGEYHGQERTWRVIGGCVAVDARIRCGRGRVAARRGASRRRPAHGARLREITQLINRYAYGIDTCGEQRLRLRGRVHARRRVHRQELRRRASRPAAACSRRAATRSRSSSAAGRKAARPSCLGRVGAT